MNAFIWLCSALTLPIVRSSYLLEVVTDELSSQHVEDDLNSTYGDVIFSSILFRHGDRNELYYFKTDKHYKRFEDGNEEPGQLVKRGRQRAYQLGMWTRTRYSSLLQGKQYSHKLIEVISSKVERTQQSAQLFLAGLFPPTDAEKWNDTIPWIPIPVYPIPTEEDNMIALVVPCPRYSMEAYQLKESAQMMKFYQTFDEGFISDMENKTGLEIPRNDAIKAIILLYGVYDNLFVQKELQLEPPSWATQDYLDRLYQIEKMYFQVLTYNDQMKRLKASPLLEKIIESMREKIHKPSPKIFKVYSGHDNTLAVLLNSLKVYDGIPPPYSAAVFVELRQKHGVYYVTMLYRTSDKEQPRLLELPDCPNPCTFEQFETAALPAMLTSPWKQACNTFDPDYNSLLF